MSSEGFSGSEHDFLAFCVKIEQDPRHWETLKVNFAQTGKQRELLKDIETAPARLKSDREAALSIFHQINEDAKTLKTEAVSYIFTDNDVLLFADIPNTDIRSRFAELHRKTAKIIPDSVKLEQFQAYENMRALKQFSEEKMRTARQVRAISSLTTDTSRREAVGIQRQNRQMPLVMLVEDDRFTAAYTTQILSKDYEVFHVRTGEEAIEYYMDYAPNAVFIDMHLPGMNGADTLHMIKAMDPDAYCVILSVDTTRSVVLLASEDGANSYLRKPYNKNRLLWTARQSPHINGLPARMSEIVHT